MEKTKTPFTAVNKNWEELKEGDILGENIYGVPQLQKGTVLNRELIELIAKIKPNDITIWKDIHEDYSIEDVKNWELGTKKEYAEKISQDIQKIIDSKTLHKKADYKILIEKFKPEHRKEANQILAHYSTSKRDIEIIEAGPKLSIREINKGVTDKVKYLNTILVDMIVEESYDIVHLKNIVNALIDDTGPKRDSSFLLSSLKRKGADLIVKHSINVALIVISIAIELTKMMENKLQENMVQTDFVKLQICNNKIFTRMELVILGIAALLHDINIKEIIPNLSEDSEISIKEESKIHFHPTNAFHFLQKIGVDYDIRKAIMQHHEYLDGTGYPENITERQMTKYSKILSFAEKYDSLTSVNPFEKKLNPSRALMHILTSERNKFDDDIIFAFCKAASLYPIGSWVALSNNKIALVFKSNARSLKKPIVKMIYDGNLMELTSKDYINLEKSNIDIKEVIDVESIELIDPRCDRFIFEEREFDRLEVNINVFCAIPQSDQQFNGNILDISGGGIKISTNMNLAMGTELIINFSFENSYFNNVKGLIVWKNEGTDSYYYGVRFVKILKEDKIFIIEKISELNNSE